MSGWLDRPRGILTHGGWIVLLALIVVGAFQVFALGRNGRSPERLPQLVRGDDALSVAFGGAKETISLAMVQKANNYFHGGVEVDCTIHHDHGDCCDHDHHEGCDHDHHSPNPETQTPQHPNAYFPDPWAWINSHVRAPEVDRHLEGEKAIELMPWLWASVRSNPHNIDAWTTAIFVATDAMKNRVLARRILDEARAKNPQSIELAYTEAHFIYDGGKGDLAAAKAAFVSARDLALRLCDGNPENLSETDRWHYRFVLNFLKELERPSVK